MIKLKNLDYLIVITNYKKIKMSITRIVQFTKKAKREYLKAGTKSQL